MRKHVSGEKGRAREEEMHPQPPLALPSAERFERLVSTRHPGSRTKRLGPRVGRGKGGLRHPRGCGGRRRRVPPAGAPRGSGASAVC